MRIDCVAGCNMSDWHDARCGRAATVVGRCRRRFVLLSGQMNDLDHPTFASPHGVQATLIGAHASHYALGRLNLVVGECLARILSGCLVLDLQMERESRISAHKLPLVGHERQHFGDVHRHEYLPLRGRGVQLTGIVVQLLLLLLTVKSRGDADRCWRLAQRACFVDRRKDENEINSAADGDRARCEKSQTRRFFFINVFSKNENLFVLICVKFSY